MTTTAIPGPRRSPLAIYNLIDTTRSASPLLWRSAIVMLAAAALLAGLTLIDAHEINGANVWDKPAKFFLAVAVQFLTVGWAMSFLPAVDKGVRVAVRTLVIYGFAENIYITGRAAAGLTSHFNYQTPFSSAAYALMGLGALLMTATSFYVGLKVWRNAGHSLWSDAAAIGLMLGGVLGTVAGVYMSAQTSHWVGGTASDANGLGFFGWSTTGGDLRVAHFVGLHVSQFVPLAALSGKRRVVYAVAGIAVLVTVLVFVQAMMGIPLFQA